MSAIESETTASIPEAHWSKRRLFKNDLDFDIYQEAYRYYGVDLSTVDVIGAGLLTTLMSEIGNAHDILTNFKSGSHLASWLGLCPDNRISGGKILSTKTRPVVNRVADALRMATQGLTHSKSEMGNYSRRMKAA